MNTALNQLLAIASGPLCAADADALDELTPTREGPLNELVTLLKARNGFYAFERAFHVFPDRSTECEIGLLEWNSPSLWIFAYDDLAEGCLFFAEDVFGGQFCFKKDSVWYFDPETAELEKLGDNLAEWAAAILADYRVRTGFPLAHEWQQQHGCLRPGCRLAPKIPFVLGGAYEIKNLYEADAIELMRYRGDLAVQLKNCPDGSTVSIKIVD